VSEAAAERPAPMAPVPEDPLVSLPLLKGPADDAHLSRQLLGVVLEAPGRGFWLLLGLAGLGTAWFLVSVAVTFWVGIGAWGNNIPVAWAFAITNFVWWIGIGHAGTLISAILLLFRARWRSSINRISEAMTLFAVMCAGLFPLLHLGRPWKFYWLVPYPSVQQIWPQFRSPLTWDIAAISVYFTVSLLFWYLGLLPDLAAARDRAVQTWKRKVYGVLCLGWRSAARHWNRWQTANLLLAGVATPLVVSVHTIVSFDFAVSQLPGWHSTIFPPYFVAGAIYSGFAMVLTLMLPARRALKLHDVITDAHLDAMARVMLVAGLVVAYGYLQEHFIGWYSGDPFEAHFWNNLRTGAWAPFFWVLIACNVIVPQLLWIPSVRVHPVALFAVAIGINFGMWLERFLIIVPALGSDFVPSSWKNYHPTWVDFGLLFGSMALFGFCFLLFLKLLPPVPLSELKHLKRELDRSQSFAESLAKEGA
jgi:molybdopterin-containing oxidoreductase family membrane subunit